MTVGILSYGLGALMFLSLTVLLATSWRGGRPGIVLILASLMTGAWCVVAALSDSTDNIPRAWILVVENLRNGAWLFFLTTVLGLAGATRGRKLVGLATHLLWIAILVVTAAKALGFNNWPLTMLSGNAVLLGQLLLSLAVLVLVEQLYRNTAATNRWAVKYLCLGIGAIYAYDLFLYAHAYLFVQISESIWNARGLAISLTVPLLAVAARRNPEWSLDIFVSRQIVFYGGSLTGVGLYLVAMAAGGLYIRSFEGSWGGFVQIVFLFGGALFLLVVALSGEVRRRLRVFISKHFYRNKYEYREEWLRLNDMLASSDDDHVLKQRAIEAMAQIIGSDGGLLLQERDGSFCASEVWRMQAPVGLAEPKASPFLATLSANHWVLDTAQADALPDGATAMPDWVEALTEPALIVPLLNGEALQGLVVLKRPAAPFALTYEDIDLLRTVSRQIAGYLAQHALDQQLAESRQFEAYNRLTSFLMHDLKNLIAQQSMVVKNAARHKDNPEFIEDAIKTIDHSVQRMQRLLQQLKAGASQETGGPANVADVLRGIEREWQGQCRLDISIAENEAWSTASSERLSMIFRHVIKNAEDASHPGQNIEVNMNASDTALTVSIRDFGVGMDANFIQEQLFRPFTSTKGSQGMGIGAYQVREFVRGLGGDVKVESQLGEGTLFVVTLPRLGKSG